jgi:molecular chaperone GrpE
MSKKETKKIQPEINNKETSEVVEKQKEPTKDELEIIKLNEQIQVFQKELENKNEKISLLENEIKTINNDYVSKIAAKANEANVLLKTKLEELSSKMKDELAVHKKYAIEKQANSIIDIVNQFAMALSYKPTDPNIAKYQSGFQMFLTMFKNLLSELGINEIKINVGDEFNPEFMECIEFVHSNELANNKVAKEITKGYKLHDRLIKPAIVNVVRKKN